MTGVMPLSWPIQCVRISPVFVGSNWMHRNYYCYGFCQVVEAETLIRRVGAPPRSYLPFRRPAPCLSLRPNSRIDSASLDDSRPRTTDAVAVGSVGQWG